VGWGDGRPCAFQAIVQNSELSAPYLEPYPCEPIRASHRPATAPSGQPRLACPSWPMADSRASSADRMRPVWTARPARVGLDGPDAVWPGVFALEEQRAFPRALREAWALSCRGSGLPAERGAGLASPGRRAAWRGSSIERAIAQSSRQARRRLSPLQVLHGAISAPLARVWAWRWDYVARCVSKLGRKTLRVVLPRRRLEREGREQRFAPFAFQKPAATTPSRTTSTGPSKQTGSLPAV
jgi:hypothetical protein